jgi:hypothetical protein
MKGRQCEIAKVYHITSQYIDFKAQDDFLNLCMFSMVKDVLSLYFLVSIYAQN